MEITQIAFFVAVMFVVLALILLLAWVAKRYMGGGRTTRTKGSPLRRRERRLSMVEAASVSPRHKLVLVRRDNTEHLLLLGGATELVVESRIVGQQEAEVNIRDSEPQFGQAPSPSESFGSPVASPTLSGAAASTFSSTSYGDTPATDTPGGYEPSLYARESSSLGLSDSPSTYGSNSPDSEPDYFASTRSTDAEEERPSYLSTPNTEDAEPTSTYESYRSPFSAPLPNSEDEPAPAYAEEEREEVNVDADETQSDDAQQSRILSRFLRKDNAE